MCKPSPFWSVGTPSSWILCLPDVPHQALAYFLASKMFQVWSLSPSSGVNHFPQGSWFLLVKNDIYKSRSGGTCANCYINTCVPTHILQLHLFCKAISSSSYGQFQFNTTEFIFVFPEWANIIHLSIFLHLFSGFSPLSLSQALVCEKPLLFCITKGSPWIIPSHANMLHYLLP